MEYETPESPRNFNGDSSVRKIALFKENFEDTDQQDEEEVKTRTRTRRTRRTTTRRRTTMRRTTSEPELVELSSQRRGQSPSWRV